MFRWAPKLGQETLKHSTNVQYNTAKCGDTLERSTVNAVGFLKRQVGLFKDFIDERIKELVNGSRVGSFEVNESNRSSRRRSYSFRSRAERDSSVGVEL
jgi:hypothetical protein